MVPPVQQSVLVGHEKVVVKGMPCDGRPVVGSSDQVAPASLDVRMVRVAAKAELTELAMQNVPLHDTAWRSFAPAGTVDGVQVVPSSVLYATPGSPPGKPLSDPTTTQSPALVQLSPSGIPLNPAGSDPSLQLWPPSDVVSDMPPPPTVTRWGMAAARFG